MNEADTAKVRMTKIIRHDHGDRGGCMINDYRYAMVCKNSILKS